MYQKNHIYEIREALKKIKEFSQTRRGGVGQKCQIPFYIFSLFREGFKDNMIYLSFLTQ